MENMKLLNELLDREIRQTSQLRRVCLLGYYTAKQAEVTRLSCLSAPFKREFNKTDKTDKTDKTANQTEQLIKMDFKSSFNFINPFNFKSSFNVLEKGGQNQCQFLEI
jgi:hypothetical protein